jgi:MinD-like ATPase involved in chromosome partitioning or flagellar assembly
MSDQAATLRSLALDLPQVERAHDDAPPLVVVSGARPGVGVTTIVANLGAVLADAGLRTVLVDAANDGQSLAKTADAVLPGKRTQPLCKTPSGALLLHHSEHAPATDGDSRRQARQLSAALQGVRHEADVFIVDAGSGVSAITRRLWRQSRHILLATTADDQAVMDSYAHIKLAENDANCDIRILVNQCENARTASRAVARIATACERFLNRTVKAAPALPPSSKSSSQFKVAPRVWDAPESPFGHAALWLGRSVIDALAAQNTETALELAAA